MRYPSSCNIICLLLALYLPAISASAVEVVSLSSLNLTKAQQPFGKPGVNLSVEGKPLSIAGKTYAHGFGTHAPSILYIDLKGGSTRFTAKVGIDEEGGNIKTDGSVEFIVEGDGKILLRTPVVQGGMEAVPISVDLTGVKKMILKVTDGGDGNGRDHADWVDANFEVVGAKPETAGPPPLPPRWRLGDKMTTFWPVATDPHLPHSDFIEQGGLRAGQVVEYGIDDKHELSIKRYVVWPCLRTIPNNTNGSLIKEYGKEAEPTITIDGAAAGPLHVDRAVLDGTLTFEGHITTGLTVTRCTYPSPTYRTAIERWTIRNNGATPHTIAVAPLALSSKKDGPYGVNIMEVSCDAPAKTVLAPGKEMVFAVLFSARLESESKETINAAVEEKSRRSYVAEQQKNLRLETPEPALNQAFNFAKLRVAESINATRGGYMLAPGGLSYYAAVWCNDNVEYAGPFFPFLGDHNGNQASLDTYRLYQKYMKPDYAKIPSSIIAEGVDTWGGAGDRGDAAMYAYGCSRFCLASGDKAIAVELWPAIEWCLEFCSRQITADGVIASNSDELEGRFPTGQANLSTSSLCYGGLRSAADLARSLGKNTQAAEYDQSADALAKAIEMYFGANVEGFASYRYYDGNDVLRSWICLPLCMGIMDRREATISALFSPRLWTDDGLATQAGDGTFWDRSTLYGLRGVFQAGETARALSFLNAYSKRRLLGEHVPYPVEAWPEGGQRHLASESGLYCRIFTEGMFGILPTGLDSFKITPRLPDGWPRMALRSIRAFNRKFDVVVERVGKKQRLTIFQRSHPAIVRDFNAGQTMEIKLK